MQAEIPREDHYEFVEQYMKKSHLPFDRITMREMLFDVELAKISVPRIG